MTERIFNFSAGPAVIPVPVLEEAQRDLLALPGVGMSVMEISHRSKTFDEIIQDAEAGLRRLLDIPKDYAVLFLQGGASLQFAMVAMNFLSLDSSADYIVTGSWGKKAVKEAQKFGTVDLAANMADGGFTRVPNQDELQLNPAASYVHLTSNETIEGVEFKTEPELGEVSKFRDGVDNLLRGNWAAFVSNAAWVKLLPQVMKLFEDGKLRLDDPVTAYLPEFQGGKSGITVRNLMTHFSGMRPDLDLEPEWSGYQNVRGLSYTVAGLVRL